MKKLGIDLDGVVADFSGKFVELANARFGTDHTVLDQHDWDFKPWFTGAQVDEVWERDIKPMKNFWTTLKTLPGTEGLWRTSNSVEPVFITSRIPTAGLSAREQSCTWLRKNFYIPFPNVLVVENPSEKLPLIKDLGLSSFVDDRKETVIMLHEAGIRTYCKLTPYNCAESYPEGVKIVETLDEYLNQELASK